MALAVVPNTLMRSLAVGPGRVLIGRGAVAGLAKLVNDAGDRTLVVSGDRAWSVAGDALTAALGAGGIWLERHDYQREVTEQAVEDLCCAARGVDAIIGVGGGKAIDCAKLVGHYTHLPVFTVPTSAATCAAWTALSNVYGPAGEWRFGVPLDHAPQALVLDYDFVATAPNRLLASGIADAMAKWYECDSAIDRSVADATTIAALELAHHLHKQLVRTATAAVADHQSEAFRRVSDSNILLAGQVGGLGGPMCRSVAAHAVANGLTQLPDSRTSYHGEKVAFGIVVQLVLQDRPLAEIEELVEFLSGLGLSLSLRSLGIDLGGDAMAQVVSVACDRKSSLHRMLLPVDSVTLSRSILEAEALITRCCSQSSCIGGQL